MTTYRVDLKLLKSIALGQKKKYEKAQRHSWTQRDHDGAMLVSASLLQRLLSFVVCGRATLGPQRQCNGYIPCSWNVAAAGMELGLLGRKNNRVDLWHSLYFGGKLIDANLPIRLELKDHYVRVPVQMILECIEEYFFLSCVEGLQAAEQYLWDYRELR